MPNFTAMDLKQTYNNIMFIAIIIFHVPSVTLIILVCSITNNFDTNYVYIKINTTVTILESLF